MDDYDSYEEDFCYYYNENKYTPYQLELLSILRDVDEGCQFLRDNLELVLDEIEYDDIITAVGSDAIDIISGIKYEDEEDEEDDEEYDNLEVLLPIKIKQEDRFDKEVLKYFGDRECYSFIDNNEMIKKIPSDKTPIETVDNFNTLISRLQEIKEDIKKLTNEKEKIEIAVKEFMKNKSTIITPRYKVMWKEYKSSRVDVKLLKKNNFEVYNEFLMQKVNKVLLINPRKNT